MDCKKSDDIVTTTNEHQNKVLAFKLSAFERLRDMPMSLRRLEIYYTLIEWDKATAREQVYQSQKRIRRILDSITPPGFLTQPIYNHEKTFLSKFQIQNRRE